MRILKEKHIFVIYIRVVFISPSLSLPLPSKPIKIMSEARAKVSCICLMIV